MIIWSTSNQRVRRRNRATEILLFDGIGSGGGSGGGGRLRRILEARPHLLPQLRVRLLLLLQGLKGGHLLGGENALSLGDRIRGDR